MMLGVIVNTLVIAVFSLVGFFIVGGVPKRIEEIIVKTLGLCILFIGIRGAFENQIPLLLIMSLVIGGIIGEIINIDKWMNRFGLWAEKKIKTKDTGDRSFSKAFVTVSLLFCTGSMAIVGSIQSGLEGNNQTLYIKSVLDGVFSLVFGATMGIGAAFSAISVLLYEGSIVLISWVVRDFFSPEMIREVSAVGNLIIAGMAFNLLGLKEIKVANLIPAMFIPCIYFSFIAKVIG